MRPITLPSRILQVLVHWTKVTFIISYYNIIVKYQTFCLISISDNYTYINDSKSWIDALGYCKTHHQTLAHILNPTAHEYITQMLQNKAITDGVWIGLERSMLFTCSPWLWTSGPYVEYASWHQEFPKDPASMFCGKLRKEKQDRFGWMDACCHERLPFICQVSFSSWFNEISFLMACTLVFFECLRVCKCLKPKIILFCHVSSGMNH